MELLRDILARYVDSAGLSKRSRYGELLTSWRAVLGPVADHTRLESVQKNVATFVVDSAPLLAELNNFRKLELLSHLQTEVHSVFIRDIRFRIGQVKGPDGNGGGSK